MCFTNRKIEQSCGFLLLDDFNAFIYCCTKCQCEFDYSSDLEMHILSEHQNDKEAVLVNDDVSVDDFESMSIDIEPVSIEIEPVDIKIEQYEANVEELNESSTEELIEGSTESNLNEEDEDDNKPSIDSHVNYDVVGDDNSDEADKVTVEASAGKRRRGRPRKTKKKRHGNSDVSTLTLDTEKSFTRNPRSRSAALKRKKVSSNESTEFRSEEPISKR